MRLVSLWHILEVDDANQMMPNRYTLTILLTMAGKVGDVGLKLEYLGSEIDYYLVV